ncbi:MAG: ABC transporter permease [Saprospiraceae bacterium]|nr:ABC transporter permease [Saprospiraceae bacterium]
MRPALYFLVFVFLLALFRDLLANGKPLYCRIEGENWYPGLRSMLNSDDIPYGHPVLDSIRLHDLWKSYPYEKSIFAPIPYSPGEWSGRMPVSLLKPGEIHTGLKPRFRHWLGTDDTGRDVAAALVGGARIAVATAALAMGVACFIGIVLGAVAGFWGDKRLRIGRIQTLLSLLFLPLAWFWAFQAPWNGLAWIFRPMLFLLFMAVVLFVTGKIPDKKPWYFPADLLIMRLAEVFNATPKLILLIVLAAMLGGQSFWLLIACIGALSWTGIAVFVRADLLRIREMDYVTAARAQGMSELRILFRHALPNALRPVAVAFALGAGAAISLEASLAFLGMGSLELRGASWGSLIENIRTHPRAWWLVLPPGLFIGFTILALNTLGGYWADRRNRNNT